ncbi:MAG: histidinol-phosphatase HisJ family protein [Bacteroidales bacterium]|nr:histidinol-phosphatase HisJ family protein [Bacteroidales bacterium]
MILFDNHIHSEYSPDGRMTMVEAVKAAEKMGLGGLSFTDHFDIDAPGDNNHFSFDPKEQQLKIDNLRTDTDLFIGKGIELGLQPVALESAKRAVSNFDFDVIIASIHFVDGIDPYHDKYYDLREERVAYGRYLETIFECISKYKDFDILGHFDYITRYSPYKNKSLTMSHYGEYLDPILRVLAENGKALEINTNTYRNRNGSAPVLDYEVLKHFFQIGGEYVALGSDAHNAVRVGDELKEAATNLVNTGFRYTTYFSERKPVLLPIS